MTNIGNYYAKMKLRLTKNYYPDVFDVKIPDSNLIRVAIRHDICDIVALVLLRRGYLSRPVALRYWASESLNAP